MGMKWLECNIYLKDYSRTNEALNEAVKPFVKFYYTYKKKFNWHFFREPQICWRLFVANEFVVKDIRNDIHKCLKRLEDTKPDLYDYHIFGAFAQSGNEYRGEENFYGKDAWELCYKRWEAGSNLALLLCTSEPEKPLPFHYIRDIHLFENQLGFELPNTIAIITKWLNRLNELRESEL